MENSVALRGHTRHHGASSAWPESEPHLGLHPVGRRVPRARLWASRWGACSVLGGPLRLRSSRGSWTAPSPGAEAPFFPAHFLVASSKTSVSSEGVVKGQREDGYWGSRETLMIRRLLAWVICDGVRVGDERGVFGAQSPSHASVESGSFGLWGCRDTNVSFA